jgi:hypothetical protein
MEGEVVAGREGGFERVGCGVGVGARGDEAQAQGDAVDVGVDGERGHVRTEKEDTGGGFAADARQAGEERDGSFATHTTQVGEIDSASIVGERAQDGLNAVRLDHGEAAAANGCRELVERRIAYCFPGMEGGLEGLKRAVRVRVRRVLRQDRADQLFERCIVRLPYGPAIVLEQAAVDPANQTRAQSGLRGSQYRQR